VPERIDVRSFEPASQSLNFDARQRDRWIFRVADDHEVRGFRMKIRVGYELIYDFEQATPVILVLGTHFTRASDVIAPDYLTTSPSVPIYPYRDGFGNWCSRIVAPAGRIRLSADGLVRDSGLPDVVVPSAWQHAVEDLPAETLVFLLGSRYCETDRLTEAAWSLFDKSPPGWARVQAICDFVRRHIAFGYKHARDDDVLGGLQ